MASFALERATNKKTEGLTGSSPESSTARPHGIWKRGGRALGPLPLS